MSIPTAARFKAKNGVLVEGISFAARCQILAELRAMGLLEEQIAEAASYSMAMVVRYALGLSASDGQVCAIAGDCVAGQIAMATLRHLVNAGANGRLVVIKGAEPLSQQLGRQLELLKPLNVATATAASPGQILGSAAPLTANVHNVICGTFEARGVAAADLKGLIDHLNDASTPLHCLEAPAGVDPDSGAPVGPPLFASSTLSLGAPLSGLHSGNEYAGRHYLCDISVTRDMYAKLGLRSAHSAFAEQPVVQLFKES